MPRKPIDYSKTHFYKIVCKDLNITDCYVGHTTDFTKRKWAHTGSHYNANGKRYNGHLSQLFLYDFIKENGGWENWEMILIDTKNCENKMEATKYEREFKEQLNSTLNKATPYRTEEEKSEYYAQWRKDNKQYKRDYNKNWHWKNKERNNKKARDNYNRNKEAISEAKKQDRIVCQCGVEIRRDNRWQHNKSKHHIQYMQSLEN